jgi:myo-inositol 2-dehydrogenase / D-chiro-inositol 1-dehydrogenase
MKIQMNSQATNRRQFLKVAGKAIAAATVVTHVATPRAGYCAENNEIKIALVGCGGRGTGAAANALATSGPTRLWAMADVFEHRLAGSANTLEQKFTSQICVPQERRFAGFEGFKKAIDSLGKGDLVILATPPAFRPIHFEYAVQRGVNVFMEKSFGVDAPGLRRVLAAGELARQKNLKVATGLMSRHYRPLEEAIAQIHSGAIGDVITAWAYRMHGPVGLGARKPGQSELAHQISNYSCFTWLNGSFIVDWLIHNIDVCCWMKNAWPVSAQGMGGRQVRGDGDQLFDHYGCEYTFADGTRMFAQGRHMNKCHDFFGDIIHGAKGSAILGEGQPRPRLYQGHTQTPTHLVWEYKGAPCDPYQREHDLLLDAIRNDKPYNEVERSVRSCLTAVMGRMACESGQVITCDEALASNLQLAPDLERIQLLGSPAPVQPDAAGAYVIAMPGRTRVL